MKSIYILLLLFIFFSVKLLAQISEFTESPRWFVLNHQRDSIEEFYYTKDTVFCGENYSVLNELSYRNDIKTKGFVRVENNKVFFRYTCSCDDREYLLYDFSLEVGDTVYCGYNIMRYYNQPTGFTDTTKFWVTDIDSIEILGIKRKRLLTNYLVDPIHSNTGFPMTWIEGIGSIAHPFYALYDWNDKSTWFDLVCLDSSGVLIYKNTDLSINCDSITGISTGLNYQFRDKVKLFPNPIENQLVIELPDDFGNRFNIELIDFKGQAIYNFGTFIEKRVNLTLPNLLTGHYIVAIRQGNEYITKKIIVAQ